MGVTIFFVLSGYLITGILILEWDSTHHIGLLNFWIHRIRRLFPAIVFLILVVAVLCTCFNHVLMTKMRPDILPALCWVSNWWYILRDLSYFEALGSPSPLTHFWSLGIEEQFYLIWPVLLLILLKKGTSKKFLRRGILVLAILSAVEMAILYDPLGDPSRVYYGTDTRAFSLLIGAWLSFIWPSSRLSEEGAQRANSSSVHILDAVGIAALVGLMLIIMLINGYSPFLYRGGIFLTSVLTAIVIAVIAYPRSILGKLLGTKPFVWVGVRSYSLYLWHYPLLLLMNPINYTGTTPWWMRLLQLAVIFFCADFSYRFIENPIRHGALGRFYHACRDGSTSIPAFTRTHVIPVVCGTLLALSAVAGIILVPDTQAVGNVAAIQQADSFSSELRTAVGDIDTKIQQLTNATDQQTTTASTADDEVATEQQLEQRQGSEAASAAGLPHAEGTSDKNILLIGDSVAETTTYQFEETYPNGIIDAVIGRQLYTGPEIYQGYVDSGWSGDTVVFCLGSNGVCNTDQINELIDAVGPDKTIYLVNVRTPYPLEEINNDLFYEAEASHSNVHVIDWYDLSANHDELFDGDGTHLTPEGVQVYIGMIQQTIG